MDDHGAWIGRTESATDRMAPSPLAGLAALLDHRQSPWPAGEAPPLGHWLCFLPRALQSDIDVDGHPKRGGFLPPIALPRRMWAGGRLSFHAPIPIGAPLDRLSTITDIRRKTGASGPLAFVTLRHEIRADGALAVVEEQDLVYREDSKAAPAVSRPGGETEPADVTCTVIPDPVLLFRFSALTFNAHRIHYDRDYAREAEGYAGLVVHGPLLATLLMDLFLRETPGARPIAFSFRAQRPLLDTAPFDLCLARTAEGAKLWTRNMEGLPTMTAEVRLA